MFLEKFLEKKNKKNKKHVQSLLNNKMLSECLCISPFIPLYEN